MANTEEQERAANLQDAQDKASALFDEIQRELIRPGVLESQVNKEIHELGQKRHNVRTHWHKRTIRSGPNTLHPYDENPPDRMIEEDDIVFVDLGPVFEAWEADFGRTFVLGDDPVKKKLRDALEPTWNKVRAQFDAKRGEMTGEQLYNLACKEAEEAGWEFGGKIAGHVVGDFPHERIPNDKLSLYITKGNDKYIRDPDGKFESYKTNGADVESKLDPDKHGYNRHWILEIHLVDRERQIGGFMEQLLTV